MFETLQTAITAIIDDVKTQQLDYVMENGKYKQIARTDEIDFEYEVHEKVAPTGIGFTCLFYATDDGKDYVKTVGFGKEANTQDWTEIIEDLI